MHDVVLLTLGDGPDEGAGCAGGCACSVATTPRVPVLTCADALTDAGARVELRTACSDAEIDDALKPARKGEARAVIAAASDGQVRAVLRRLIREYAPAPSQRPATLPADRTVPDLPPIGILPLAPACPELVGALGLPRDPVGVAAAVLGGRTRRLDLLRNDGGSVTLRGALLGAQVEGGLAAWHGRIEVDDVVLSDGEEPVLACSIVNVGSSDVDGLPLVVGAEADDGQVSVAVAVPVLSRRLLRPAILRFEVRRARGRAASVTPRTDELSLVDDGVSATLTRKRSWWVERAVWAAYIP